MTSEETERDEFAIGDPVIMTANNRRGIVIKAWEESFSRGGVQQVIEVRWDNGAGTVMRAAHFARRTYGTGSA